MAEGNIEIDLAELGLSLQVLFATSRKLLLIRKRRGRLPSGKQSGKISEDDLSREEQIFEAAVQAYSRAWCRSFARQMMRHIPAREIRDIIYTQIVEDLDYKEVMASKEEFWRPSPRTLPSWRRTLPRVITRAFMGTQFAMAISQTIYETACFWIRDSEDLKDLLLQGPLEPDLVAPFDFIRRLNVVINLTHFLNPPRASRQVRVHKDVEAISDQRIRNIHECSRMKHVKCLKLDLEVQTDVPDCNTTFDEAVL